MKVVLEVTDGPHAGFKKSLRDSSSVRVGRTDEAGFTLDKDRKLSGLHFSVRCDGGQCILEDLKSTNGTYVNGDRVSERVLQDGDKIKAGKSHFVVHIDRTAQVDSPTPGIGGGGWDAEPWPAQGSAAAAPAFPTSPSPLPGWGSPAPVSSPAPIPSPSSLVDSDPWGTPMKGATSHVAPAAVERDPWGTPTPSPSPHSPAPFIAPPPMAAPIQPSPQPTPRAAESQSFPPYNRGFNDEDPAVRREALWAAAWKSEPSLIQHCRAIAATPNPEMLESLWLLAILGQASDLPLVENLGRLETLGPRRFAVLGAYGHPRAMDAILEGVAAADPATAEAAAQAFEKITGLAVTRGLPSGDEEAARPNAEHARSLWSREHSVFARSNRWSRGVDVARQDDTDSLMQLDLPGRREAFLRGCYWQKWPVGPWKLEVYPQAGP